MSSMSHTHNLQNNADLDHPFRVLDRANNSTFATWIHACVQGLFTIHFPVPKKPFCILFITDIQKEYKCVSYIYEP